MPVRPIAVLAAAATLLLTPLVAKAGGETEIDAPFFTMEDGTHYGTIIQKKQFRWLFQKPFIAGVVARALVARGFDPATAKRIADDWDGWRYDFETGERILPKPPMQMKAEDAVELARRIPSCLADLSKGDCKMRFAMDFGCSLSVPQQQVCQRNYAITRETAASFGTGVGGTLYKSLACMEEGGKGADMVVFAPAEVQAASKMKFDAVAQANSAPVPASLPAAPPPPAAAPAPAPAPAPTAAAPAARPTAAAPARPSARPACSVIMAADTPAAKRVLKAEFGRDNADVVEINLVDKIEETMKEVRTNVRQGKPLDNHVAAARDLGIDLQLQPKIAMTVPAAAGLRGPRRIEEFREGWIGAHSALTYENLTLPDGVSAEDAIITDLSANGAAARAGLKIGDKVVKFDGKDVGIARDLVAFTRDAAIGGESELVIDRDGRRQTVKVAVTAMPDDAQKGDALASRVMGRLRTFPYGEPADHRAALGWFEKAAAAGDSYAMIGIARLHFGSSFGATEGIPKNDALGMQWLRRAAAAGNVHANFDLGQRLNAGKGAPKDLTGARRAFETAAKAGMPNAMNDFALMLAKGEGGPASLPQARQWFLRAAEAGNILAMRNTGIAFRDGIGGPADVNAARTWFSRAAAKGDRSAAEMLSKLR